jgi:DNA-binding transcriptional LysR family regulator
MSLTESGYASLERAARILEEGEAVEAEVSEQSDKLQGVIRVSAPMSFGLARLVPLLPAFMQTHPEVKLDVQFDDKIVDLVADRFDLALRITNLADSSLLARRLCRVRILLVGSPEYFKRYGKPQHPSDLAAHQALQYAYSRLGTTWRFHHNHHGEFSLPMAANLHVNNA